MKIKVIDLLVKIANNEEVPKKIKLKNFKEIYTLREDCTGYKWYGEEKTNNDFGETIHKNLEYILKQDIEILEEPKKIEKLDVALLGQCDNWLRCPTNKVTKQDVELNPYIIDNIRENTLYFQRKINELIDEINNLKGND